MEKLEESAKTRLVSSKPDTINEKLYKYKPIDIQPYRDKYKAEIIK